MMKINKEGYTIILIFTLISAIISFILFRYTMQWIGWSVSVILLLALLFILWFFRKPVREILHDENIVFSPADGKIVAIEEVEEKEYLGCRVIQVSVFMSLTNVHMNWFPVGGKIEYYKYHPGKFMVAWHPKSSEDNERTTTVVDTGKNKILFRQIAGFVARRIVSYAVVGKEVEQNQKCGFIKFGSRLDVMVPLDSEILVKLDDRVTGSQTPLARFNQKN